MSRQPHSLLDPPGMILLLLSPVVAELGFFRPSMPFFVAFPPPKSIVRGKFAPPFLREFVLRTGPPPASETPIFDCSSSGHPFR